MEIRFAEITDLQQILEMYKELNPEDKPIDLTKAQEIWINSINGNYIKYIVALENGKIIATCNIAVILNLTRSGRPYGIIENVITDENYRRKGIGRKIINAGLRFAKDKNCYKVVLLSSIKRKESHEFYESIGFDSNSKKGFEIRL